nr:hypothetical protein [Bacteroidota bacterium]
AHNTLKMNTLRMLKEMRINTGKSSSKAEEWQRGSKKMMMYLQAYDLLRAGAGARRELPGIFIK